MFLMVPEMPACPFPKRTADVNFNFFKWRILTLRFKNAKNVVLPST